MVDASRLPGQDGKHLPWRHMRTKKGDPVGRPYRGKKPFLRGARECFFETTRINSDKWERWAGKWGFEGIPSQVYGIFKGSCGTPDGFGAGGQELF